MEEKILIFNLWMATMTKKISALFAILVLSGCGSIYNGTTQKMTILTPGAENSECALENDIIKSHAHPPQTIKVKRNRLPLTIICTAPGNRVKSTILAPKITKAGAYNAITFSIPGAIYDDHSGALYEYPEVVEIDFNNVPAISSPKPKYENPVIKKDSTTNMEYMGPTTQILPNEKTDNIKREIAEKEANIKLND